MKTWHSFTRHLLGTLLLLGALSGCGGMGLQGSGVAKTEKRPAATFTTVEVSSAVQMEITVGPAASLEVTADDNLLPHLVTQVTDGVLKVHLDTGVSTQLGVKVKATTPSLQAVHANGASSVQVRDLRGKEFRLTLNGASSANLAVTVDALDLKVSGASHCTVSGRAESLSVDCSGAGRVDAVSLSAQKVRAEAGGAATVEVNAAQSLAARASGASTIRYTGQPTQLERNADTTSNISPK